jgi:hypothetical protein
VSLEAVFNERRRTVNIRVAYTEDPGSRRIRASIANV